jgi:hypothetical protein
LKEGSEIVSARSDEIGVLSLLPGFSGGSIQLLFISLNLCLQIPDFIFRSGHVLTEGFLKEVYDKKETAQQGISYFIYYYESI